MLALFFKQFAKPTGWFGHVIGKVLATSNQEINEWTISQLEINSNERVLEIGYGPGTAIEHIYTKYPDTTIAGIDVSDVMCEQASSRNEEGIKEGRIDLRQSNVTNLPTFDDAFHKVFTVNNYTLWDNQIECLQTIRSIMKPKGRIAITLQPRSKGASDETTEIIADKIMNDLITAGFSEVQLSIMETKPTDTVCVLGINA